jgi:hypothetical protein
MIDICAMTHFYGERYTGYTERKTATFLCEDHVVATMILPPDELFQEALCFGGQISNKPMEKLREFTSDV